MTRTRWLWLVAAAGLTIFAISFVQGWIVHERELRGEGYRFVRIFLSAWRGVAIPVTAAAAVAALAVGLLAVAAALGRIRPSDWLLIAVRRSSSASSAHRPGRSCRTGMRHPSRSARGGSSDRARARPAHAGRQRGRRRGRPAGSSGHRRVLAVVAFAGGAGGRWLGLQLAEGTGALGGWLLHPYRDRRPADRDDDPHRSDVPHRRALVGNIRELGWTVVLDDDPACPTARGTYHAHGVDEADLRFVMVVDPCMDGARAADLETGIWNRDP